MDTCHFPQTSPPSPEYFEKDFNPPFKHFRIKSFLYVEVFEDNRSHASWSAGRGTFFDGTPDLGTYDISFSVYKDRTKNTIDITVHSDKLLNLLQETFEPDYQAPQAPLTFGYAHFLPNYEALKTKLLDNESRIFPNALSEEIVELGLFVREFLTERAIFDSFGLEFLREQGILSVTQWKDIQSRSIQDDLDDLDESFDLSPGLENETSNETFEGERLLDPETQSRLRSAIRWGDVAAIETLLSQKTGLADPDTLICVLMSDDLAIFRSFLIHGAISDGDTPNHFYGPLYTAAERGCFRRFRRSGPLFAVAKCGLLKAVETLLQHGLNVEGNAETYSDPWSPILSPLYAAASCGYPEIVEYLHKHGASIGQAQHNCPLMEAARNGHLTVVQYLHQHRASNNGDLLKELLTEAAKNGHLTVVQYLLQHGPSDNGRLLYELLIEAAKNGHLTVVQYIHEQTEPLWCGKYFHWQIQMLHHAAETGDLAVVQRLIESDASIYDYSGNHALSMAAKNGHLAVVQYLHQHGADINGTEYNGTEYNFRDSPLAMAATHGHLAVVEYLLEHNANIKDDQSQPLGQYSYTSCPLTIAAQNGYLLIVQCLLERGADVDGGNQRSAPISEAARHGHLDVVEFLLEHGASDEYGLFLRMVKARHRRNHALQSLYGDESERAALQIIEAIREERYLAETPYLAESAIAEILPDHPPYPRPKILASPTPVPSCPLIAEIQARERQRILWQRRTALSEIHQRLIDQSSSSAASEAFVAFGEASNSYEGVWKEGVGVMRKLINGHLPHGLHEVVNCLQAADAMRLANSNKKVSTEYIYECSREEFINDLGHWGSLISQDELPLFGEIVSAVWQKDYNPANSPLISSDFKDTLSYLQKLVINIIPRAGILRETWGLSDSQGYRLQSMQNFYKGSAQFEAPKVIKHAPRIEVLHHTRSEPGKRELWKEKHESPLLSDTEKQPEIPPKVVTLMAGAIFGIIVYFLLLLRFGSPIPYLPAFGTRSREAALNSLQILARNCALLVAYLGLHLSLPNISSSDWTKTSECAATSQWSYSVNSATPLSSGVSSSDTAGSVNGNSSQYESDSAGIFQPSPSTQATEKSSPPSPLSGSVGAEEPRCPKCDKTFANVGNKNRHISSDCKFDRKREFPCRNIGCKRVLKPFTRKSYRNDHERERCKIVRRRQARGING